VTARDARAEAQRLLIPGLVARVLEPSPPAVGGPWFADDPVQGGELPSGHRLVAPVPLPGAITWDEWLADNHEHAAFVSERWLGAHLRLTATPAAYTDTRLAVHRVAAYVVSPARRAATGQAGLRWTLGGLGTPFFGDAEQVRIQGDRVIRQRGEIVASQPLSTLAGVADFVLGGPPETARADLAGAPEAGDPDADLRADPIASTFLGHWLGFAWSVLEELRADPGSLDPGRVQLWPGRLDATLDCGPAGRRATFGASPGDDASPEPYLYVLPSEGAPRDGPWDATGLGGAVLPLADLVHAPDQRGAALGFLRAGREAAGA
jgi:hypothetical protein